MLNLGLLGRVDRRITMRFHGAVRKFAPSGLMGNGVRRTARGPPCFAADLGDERSIRVAGRPSAGHRLIARAEPFSSIYAKFTGFRFSMSRLLAAFPVAAKAMVMV
jgi:hypothetical protein